VKWAIRYVHKIAPSDKDVASPVELPEGCFADRRKLGKALRDARVLNVGARVDSFRVEADRVVVFPTMPGLTTYWHSVILTAQQETPAPFMSMRACGHESPCTTCPEGIAS
jgi:hypothetical protein